MSLTRGTEQFKYPALVSQSSERCDLALSDLLFRIGNLSGIELVL